MLKKFGTRLKNEFKGYNGKAFSKDLMAGLTVTAVALPLALAFGESCGASAAAGLVTAIIAGLIIGALSGASFQISGPTGAMSAILIGIVAGDGGLQSVFFVSFFAGIIILLCALFKLGKLVQMIPRPVITGFTSGIAIIIALGQIDNFFGTTSKGENAIAKIMSYSELGFTPEWQAIVLGLIVIAVMIFWPKKLGTIIPGSLIGIIISTIVCIVAGFNVPTVGEIPKTLFLEERLNFASFDISNLTSYISPAISIAALGIIESLLCGASASRMKDESFDANQELLAQGIGNVIIPFFGGVPATAAIARTSVAIKSGCNTRICGIIHALGLLASMFLLGPIMALLPLSALAGVLIVTAWRMNEWSSIKSFFREKNYSAIAKFIITMISTVVFDLTVAILIGVAFSAILYIVNTSKLKAEINHSDEKSIITIKGAIFFINAGKLESITDNLPNDCKNLEISLEGVDYIDTTASEVLSEISEKMAVKKIELNIIRHEASNVNTIKA